MGPAYANTTERVENEARIAQMLKRACERESELHFQFDKLEQIWRATLLRVDQKKHRLVFGQLVPSNWTEYIGDSAPVRIFCPVKDNSFSFRTELEVIGREGAVSFFEAELPDSVTYYQQRRSYRVAVYGCTSQIAITNGEDSVYHGEIINLSAGGCRCFISASEFCLGDPRETLLCHLRIESMLELECTVRICHLALDQRGISMSMEFQGLDDEKSAVLQSCLMNLERSTVCRIDDNAAKNWHRFSG